MNKPTWFADEVRRISKKRNISALRAERDIIARIDILREELGNEADAINAYNLARVDSIDEDAFVEEYTKERGVSADVARAAFRSLPI